MYVSKTRIKQVLKLGKNEKNYTFYCVFSLLTCAHIVEHGVPLT